MKGLIARPVKGHVGIADHGMLGRLVGKPTLAAMATIFMHPEIFKEVYAECRESMEFDDSVVITGDTKAQIVEQYNQDMRLTFPGDRVSPIKQDDVKWKRIVRIFGNKMKPRKP